MASQSELTFGSRLRRALDLTKFVAGFEGYAPPRMEESVEEMNKLLAEITSTGDTVRTAEQNYNTAVTNRFNIFKTGETSMFKLMSPLRALVQAQYGKDSLQYTQVYRVIARMRKGKVKVVTAADGVTEKRISQSEQSYGSATQVFSDLIQTLSSFEDYQPARVEFQVASLREMLARVNELNDAVATQYQLLKTARDRRRALYDDLTERVRRIKAWVKGNYGLQSQEYKLVKGLRI